MTFSIHLHYYYKLSKIESKKSMMRSISCIAVFACVAIVSGSCHTSDTNQKEINATDKQPQYVIEINPYFKVEQYYGESKRRLRLNDFHFKSIFTTPLLSDPAKPLVTSSVKVRDELVPCPTNATESLDCKPLKSFSFSKSYLSYDLKNEDDLYIKQTTIREKGKFNKYIKYLKDVRSVCVLYPLRQDFVLDNIRKLESADDIGKQQGSKLQNLNYGYYFEVTTQVEGPFNPFTFTGFMYLSVNISEEYIAQTADPDYPESLDFVDYLYEQASTNSYRLKFSNVSLQFPGLNTVLRQDFYIAQQVQFPYLTVRHNMTVEMGEEHELVKYEALVDQKHNLDSHPESYNTTLNITSRSYLMPMLNFDLNQEFVNQDSQTGSENMQLITGFPNGNIMFYTVASTWNPEHILKSLKVSKIPTTQLVEKLFLTNPLEGKEYIRLAEKELGTLLLSYKPTENAFLGLNLTQYFLEDYSPAIPSITRHLKQTEVREEL